MRGNIFLSYRREDSSGHAGRLFDHLEQYFGKERVFMDIDDVSAGSDFSEVIQRNLNDCDVFIVVIGPEWLSCRDDKGQRRIDNCRDFVRTEIMTALEKKLLIIPVLVKGARIPSSEDLPKDICSISMRQSIDLTENRWDYDCEQLISIIKKRSCGFGEKLFFCPKAKVRFLVAAASLVNLSILGLTIWVWKEGLRTAQPQQK